MSTQVRELIEAMPSAFQPAKAGSSKALIQLDLTGEDAGKWVIDVAEGQCQVREEVAAQPGVTVTMDGSDFAALLRNELDPVPAFMAGKIKVSGNIGLVMQMMSWFDRG